MILSIITLILSLATLAMCALIYRDCYKVKMRKPRKPRTTKPKAEQTSFLAEVADLPGRLIR